MYNRPLCHLLLFALITVCGLSSQAVSQTVVAKPLEWQPERTWVFVIGVLEYDDPNAGFPKEYRQDLKLIETLKARGVPQSQIVALLDTEARSARVTEEFAKLLSRSQAGDWLILYYCGHGNNDAAHRETYLQTTDVSPGNPGVRVGALLTQLETNFQGDYAIIGADHCNSGGLVQSIRNMKRTRVGCAAFCSAHVNSVSTGAWTFTENLVYGFRGDAGMDDNQDGLITLGELGDNVMEDMSFADDQMAQYTCSAKLQKDTVIARTAKRAAAGVGERVEVEWLGDWYRALVVDRDGDRFLVNYYGYPDPDNEWVAKTRIRRLTKKVLPSGKRVRILWGSDWFTGKILAVKHGLHLVRYDGWGEEWNEWVPIARLHD